MIASDGFIARPSGPWAAEKLEHVEHYMAIFTKGMASKWKGDLSFLDMMSGPGLCIDRNSGREFPGSPLLALRTPTPFRRVVCIEADAECAEALQARVHLEPRAGTARVVHGDANSAAAIAAMRQGAGALSFAFVDLIGQEIAFSTIRSLTDGLKIDLLFSFPEMDLVRNSPLAAAADADRWTSFFGTDAWHPIVEGRRYTRLGKLRELYEQQLAGLGYATKAMRRPMTNSRRGPIYRLLFASKHARGVEFFTKTSGLDPGRQRTLWA